MAKNPNTRNRPPPISNMSITEYQHKAIVKKKRIEIETKGNLGRPSRKALDFGKNKIAQTQLTLGFGLVGSSFTTPSHVVLSSSTTQPKMNSKTKTYSPP